MADNFKRFIVDNLKMKNAYYEGFEPSDEGLRALPSEGRHTVFVKGLDSGEEDAAWGRLILEYKLNSEAVVIVRAFATDEKTFFDGEKEVSLNEFFFDSTIPADTKKAVINEYPHIKSTNHNDILMYELKGRYLFLSVEVFGSGENEINGAVILLPGDNFMQTFPEIYNERNSFFHRYMSIFSSIYNDFQEKIDGINRYMDIDTTPKEFLPMFASWLGLDLNVDSLEENKLRKLIKTTMYLNRHKGTRTAIERVVGILVESGAIIVERSAITGYLDEKDRAIYDKIYGKTGYDFTVLINRPYDEKLRSQLIYLVGQFKPIRSKVNFVFLGDCCTMDSYCYMDINAKIHVQQSANIDDGKAMDGSTYLED